MPALDACGFDHDSVSPLAVPTLLPVELDRILAACRDPRAGERPSPERWSVLEYAAHVRDVLLTVRDRLIGGCAVEGFRSSPIFRDERVSLGLYVEDSPESLARDYEVASRLLLRAIEVVPDDAWSRTIDYSVLLPGPAPLSWVAVQALHEARHHAADCEQGLALLG